MPTLAETGAAFGLLLALAHHRRDRPMPFMLLSGAAISLAAWPLLRILNHLTMSIPFPLADARLAALDATIGFDWLAYVRWMDAHPGLLGLTNLTYQSLSYYSCAAFLLLLVARGPARAREFVLLFLSAAILTIVTGILLPARGAMLFHAPEAALFHHIVPGETGTYFWPALNALRSDPNHMLELGNLPGLVAIPSFHTAMGVIMICCSRGGPRLFLPSLTLNLLMIAGTPVWGGHYAVDILAGAGLALTLVVILRWRNQGQARRGFARGGILAPA
ncbi:MAG: phosphatase PAP2 family protein [Sphingomonas bacterium]